MSPSTTSKVTTDHDEIRHWAEARGAKPAAVRRTESDDDPGIIRLEFPDYSGGDSLEEISWDEWFRKFDGNGLALLYQEHIANGDDSNFNQIIRRETAEEAERSTGGKGRSATHKGAAKRAKTAKTAASRGRAQRSEGREQTTRKSASGRGRSSTAGRASTRSRSGEKRASSASRGGASRGSAARTSRTTSRAKGARSSSRTGETSGRTNPPR